MSKILCILDGFGLAPKSPNNAAALAKMPNFKYLLKNYFWTTLKADGENVGQEAGLVGNSEVGHMNIGGLKLVPQLSYQITKSATNAYDLDKNITPDQLFDPKKFLTTKFEGENKTIHLIGLFSTGTIHSDLRHWAGAIEAAGKAGAENIVMHLISDGRDSDRQSLVATWDYFVKEFEAKIKPFEAKIFLGSLGGRFYSLDRDNNWDRVARGLSAMICTDETRTKTQESYNIKFKNYVNKKYGIDLFDTLKKEKLHWEKNNFPESGNIVNDSIDWVKKVLHIENSKPYHIKNGATYAKETSHFDTDNFYFQESIGYIFTDDVENDGNENLSSIGSVLACHADEKWYEKEIYDEFLPPVKIEYQSMDKFDNPTTFIQKNDTVWLLNFRTDRMKEFAQVLTDINQEFELDLTILGMNDYCIGNEIYLDENFHIARQKSENGYYPIFKNKPVENTLAEYISKNEKSQLHIAETEKYNHVTYFMNGGQNKKWEAEDWAVIDSNKVASHAEMPEMKAKEVTDYILESGLGKYDYILVNYANPDMVGHTGDINAATRTMEFLDEQLGRLIKACEAGGHEMVIIADHGNVEKVGSFDSNGKTLIDTEHNANSVPLIILSEKLKVKSEEILKQVQDDRSMFQDSKMVAQNDSSLLNNIQKLIENKTVSLDLEQFKNVLSQSNQVDFDGDLWLTNEEIPKPVLSLWYAGLILIGL